MIPKANGGERPLGIPTIRDRVAQAAAKLVLEPIFEADFTEHAYGYRPNRSANQAVKAVHESLKAGYVQVVDADLSKYFDTIPHGALLRSVARRVSDGRMLHLIKRWLTTPVEERNERGTPIRQAAGHRGTPQGGVISPPTIVQNAPFGARVKRGCVHPIDHFDLLLFDLDTFDQGANHVPLGVPFDALQAGIHLPGEGFQVVDDQAQLASLRFLVDAGL